MYSDFVFVSVPLLPPLIGIVLLLVAWVAARRSEGVRRRLPLIVLLVILAMLAAALAEVLFIDPASIR